MFTKVGHVVKGCPNNPFANLFEVYLIEECVPMMLIDADCGCKTTVTIPVKVFGKTYEMCPDCAKAHNESQAEFGKFNRVYEAEGRLIEVVKGDETR